VPQVGWVSAECVGKLFGSVVPGAVTDVVAAERARGVDEPWERGDFVEMVVSLQRQRELAPLPFDVHVQVFDRSPLCSLALTRCLRRPVTPLLAAEVDRLLREQVYEPRYRLSVPLGSCSRLRPAASGHEGSLVFERACRRLPRAQLHARRHTAGKAEQTGCGRGPGHLGGLTPGAPAWLPRRLVSNRHHVAGLVLQPRFRATLTRCTKALTDS
jgi:hypothetical protein